MSDPVSRGEHNDVLRRVESLEETQRESLELLHSIDKRTELTQKDIAGNGAKGIKDRIGDIERYVETHPRICPVVRDKKEILAARSLEVGVMGVVVTVLTLVLRVVFKI